MKPIATGLVLVALELMVSSIPDGGKYKVRSSFFHPMIGMDLITDIFKVWRRDKL
ncbi:hypothetical protein GCM10007416_30380 [Kroppenstedtia guangzhouensis]|uniref:Uncharacterized protein n=1 Tax=Kroppenstedtia guangzhouensis TaxID=1274356 RepID=A0ABQ1H1X7_9BACL|nr:hypothetical protein [Kroppenstedtia guangzhouensis]GGA55080.1 hypothetical protein GCM10007416_30380 [Kroppenstedtia guangzhouensis]